MMDTSAPRLNLWVLAINDNGNIKIPIFKDTKTPKGSWGSRKSADHFLKYAGSTRIIVPLPNVGGILPIMEDVSNAK